MFFLSDSFYPAFFQIKILKKAFIGLYAKGTAILQNYCPVFLVSCSSKNKK